MNKILSLCIPAYNMEEYLPRCIDSLIEPTIIDDLEIIIVNDGSKDNTLAIANTYREKYHDSIIIVDKPNGHYGSCINASLRVATGKYFRILDADDWFDTEVLKIVINRLSKINTDVYFTKCMVHDFVKNKKVSRIYRGIEWNKTLNLDEVKIPDSMLSMHSLTYKTRFLKEMSYVQTEGICYTDTEYVCYPMCQARTLFAEDVFLYQYYIGRDGQSMSFSSIERNISHSYPLIKRFSLDKSYLHGNKNAKYIHDHFVKVSATQLYLYSIVLCTEDKSRDQKNRDFLNEIKQENKDSFNTIIHIKAKGFFLYILLWYYCPLLVKIFRIIRLFYR